LNTFDDIHNKEGRLSEILKELQPLIVAFSGGVDSSYLLAAAIDIVGKNNVIAVTAQAPFFSSFETQHIDTIINMTGARHIVFKHQAMLNEKFIRNPPDRCYHCKKMIFSSIRNIADLFRIESIVHGTNTDDLNEFRPGTLAAEEFDIKAPLLDAHLSKSEIAILARNMALDNWNQPAMACLATRIPYHSDITMEKLSMIHQAELILFNMGFPGARVRLNDETAKIEIRQNQLLDFLEGQYEDRLFSKLQEIGFVNMMVDMNGYGTKTTIIQEKL